MSTARPRASRARSWFRALVLLLALSVSGGHVALAQTGPVPGTAQECEHDLPATPARPGARPRHHADTPDRTAPPPAPASAPAGAAPDPERTRPPHTAPLLSTVVLRC
ncbi:hypothetical protein E5082_12055 [Streptomyces griseoluteus]|uniref:Secreted protein n=1 Tax=Streptomyces griseoluteus TaxID=29306 RepID=A0A4Z1DIC0_STRGP|nr:hypothetical protein [Streptomyces griseoluteus]TGN83613.1 hypothetical protein E5082_12055 [Streptomyces griseoluteus]GHF03692.1 hypothetical protein GCM10017776_21530 [Streptomyces griseoluteus]